MKRTHIGGVAVLAVAALAAGGMGTAANAGGTPQPAAGQTAGRYDDMKIPNLGNDNKPNKRMEKQAEIRKAAVAAYVRGEARLETRGGGEVIAYKAPGADKVSYVQYASTRTEKVWSILSEFGEAGPKHNQLKAPDKATDNSTNWVKDFNLKYYQGLFSNSPRGNFTDFYKRASNGKFIAQHTVEDWVTVPHDTAYYGGHDDEGGDDKNPWAFIKDTVTAWAAKKKAAGMTDAQIATYVQQFDKWDRYDWDGDGNFNEPDGYIDHFQAIHAGEGEEAGATNPDAIWSHSWAVGNVGDGDGPAKYGKIGGAKIPGTDIWVANYTVEPENGGLGVFVHEFGHDLGLRDYYDTSRQGANSSTYWTLMSGGSWASKGNANLWTDTVREGTGTNPTNLGAHEKLLLGWSTVMRQRWYPGTSVNVNLSPSAGAPVAGQSQAVAVAMPRQPRQIKTAKPFAGSWMYWTGNESNTYSWLKSKAVIPAGGLKVNALVGGNAEADYDFMAMVYKNPTTGKWELCLDANDPTAPMKVDGPVGTIDPATGLPTAGANLQWIVPDQASDTTSLVNKTVELGIVYKSDGGVNEGGYYLDNITTSPAKVAADGAETTSGTWYAFAPATGETKMQRAGTAGYVTQYVNHYYLLENRQYVGYDANLANGIYNFDNPVDNHVTFYGYNDGMLVWYVNDMFTDNKTSHPGQGFALPVDANPVKGGYVASDLFWTYANGTKAYGNANLQSSDSTFKAPGQKYLALNLTQQRQLTEGGPAVTATLKRPALPAVSVFNDSSKTAYWKNVTETPQGKLWSVMTPHSGLKASVLSQNATTKSYVVRLDIPANFTGQWK